MHYLLLIYMDETRWAGLSQEEKAGIDLDSADFSRNTKKPGFIQGCVALHPSGTATTVRQRSGKPVITDGPVAETTEMLAGFVSADCRDLGEAILLAARLPIQRVGGVVEIRPVNGR